MFVSEETDPTSLRNLDKITLQRTYKIVVVRDKSAMRGFDYRYPTCTMTLVIDRSFDTLRDAIQGYNRVGRFGDACKRVRFNDVELIDKESPFLH